MNHSNINFSFARIALFRRTHRTHDHKDPEYDEQNHTNLISDQFKLLNPNSLLFFTFFNLSLDFPIFSGLHRTNITNFYW